MGAALLAAMGLLGLVLASVGLYGVVAFSVARRTREIGVRMAMGSRRRDVLLQVLDDGIPGMQLAAGFEFPRVGRVQIWSLDGALGSVAMANTPHSNSTQEITP